MTSKKLHTSLITLSVILTAILANASVMGEVEETESPHDLVISGLVEHPTNFTYNELQSFPMISEAAVMECVAGWTEFYNWTGIPLSLLLGMTGLKSGAKEVVFYASDGFSSSLTVEEACRPTTLLALWANGTALSYSTGHPYRLVVPCKYGYKWVRQITKIEVVDYDYKGTYEEMGYSDEADIPNCALPLVTPFRRAPTYNELLDKYNQLKSDYDDLESEYAALTRGLGYTKNLSWVFILATIIFIATTAYLAIMKRNTKPELETT